MWGAKWIHWRRFFHLWAEFRLGKGCTFGQTQLTLLSLTRMRGKGWNYTLFANSIVLEDTTIPQKETLVRYICRSAQRCHIWRAPLYRCGVVLILWRDFALTHTPHFDAPPQHSQHSEVELHLGLELWNYLSKNYKFCITKTSRSWYWNEILNAL